MEHPTNLAITELLDELTVAVCERFGEPVRYTLFDPANPAHVAHHGLTLLRSALGTPEVNE